jgi:hypothetical protein
MYFFFLESFSLLLFVSQSIESIFFLVSLHLVVRSSEYSIRLQQQRRQGLGNFLQPLHLRFSLINIHLRWSGLTRPSRKIR